MKYTIRYAHLESIPDLDIGHVVKRGDVIGKMGNTGKSSATHLHIDLIKGAYVKEPWRLSDTSHGIFDTDPVQLTYFIDKELFYYPLLVTSYYCDPNYKDSSGNLVIHLAYDVVPKDRHTTKAHYPIHWNRTSQGAVISKGHDIGYGNYLHIGFER